MDFHGLDPQTHDHHLAKKHLPMAESIFVVSAAGDVHLHAGSTSGTGVPNDVKGKIPSSKNVLMLPSGKQT